MTATIVEDAAAGDAAASRRLGACIRQLRQRRGLTLVRLAEATGLSHPFLSQLERGLAQPSLSSLRRIAVALQTSPIELIAAADAPDGDTEAVEVHRRGETALDASFASGSARMLAHGRRAIHPLEVSGDQTEPGETFVHGEDEFLYVVEGEVCVELDGTQRCLRPGDSVYYAGGVSHRWWSAGGASYRLVVVKQGPALPRWEGG
ncbi:helix-turn-helix domain-containing protein [Microbacterium sp. NPDC078428]|uniref:helix-turn-helix domain-containing protein n=1 Tax=Microbacterium sp. NPDC078428 TaxID=3364190 RepID=UPI0037C56546